MEQQGKPRRIDFDLPCIKCGYNLRTMPVEGRCPECGHLVHASILDAARRRTTPWRHDQQFCMGMRTAILLHGAWLMLLVVCGVLLSQRFLVPKDHLLASITCAMWVVSHWSVWWLINAVSDRGRSRWLARAGVLVAAMPPFISSVLPISGPLAQWRWMDWLNSAGVGASSLVVMFVGALLCRKLLSLRLEWLAAMSGLAVTAYAVAIVFLRDGFRRTRGLGSAELVVATPHGLAGYPTIYVDMGFARRLDDFAILFGMLAPTVLLVVIAILVFQRAEPPAERM